MAESRVNRQGKLVSAIKGKKCGNYNIRLPGEQYESFITGIAMTMDGRRLLIDRYNNKVKMYSESMDIISSLCLPAKPWDIAITGPKEVVISVPNEPKLLILKVSARQMKSRGTVELLYKVFGLATYNNKILVTSRFPTPSVKLIDKRGNTYWSTSTDHQGQKLFSRPEYLTCFDDGNSSTVIVTDFEKNMLTLLNSNTGDVISRHHVENQVLCGVTTDTTGNIYVCYYWTSEVGVLSQDFSKENIVLTVHDGVSLCPQAIAYDSKSHQLMVSCNGDDFDVFQLPAKPVDIADTGEREAIVSVPENLLQGSIATDKDSRSSFHLPEKVRESLIRFDPSVDEDDLCSDEEDPDKVVLIRTASGSNEYPASKEYQANVGPTEIRCGNVVSL